MKAIVVTRPGGPEVLEVRDIPEPHPTHGEVLVRVEAVGVNFADTMSTRGSYPGTPAPPFVTGREFAGVVETTGERVMGYTQYCAETQTAVAAAQGMGLGPVGGLPCQLPYRLPGVLEGGTDCRCARTHSM